MRKMLCILLFFLLHASVYACELSKAKAILAEINWVAEDYPPFNYVDVNGEVTGIFTDALLAIYHQLELPLTTDDIEVIPWARLYHLMQKNPDYAAFSMTDTETRRQKFTLIPLPYRSNISIMVKATNKNRLMAKPIKDLSIAVVREDIGQHLLDSRHIRAKQIQTISASGMLKMLMHERVDAIAYAEDVAHFQFKKLGFGDEALVSIHVLEDSKYNNYIFHRDFDSCALALFTNAIETLDKQNRLQTIISKYLDKKPKSPEL